MSTPVASILIPCFNAEPWLGAALDSALGQGDVPVEVIVIDDGSSDASIDLVRAQSRRGVRLLQQAHRGASAARNRGLAEARGHYIQFLDADDLLGPAKISRQIARLEAGSAGSAVASCAWGRFDHRAQPETAAFVDTAVFRDFTPATDFLKLHAATGAMMHVAAWLTPRSLLDAAGPWDERLSMNDDGEYFARVLRQAGAIRFAPDVRTYYRSNRTDSLSQRRTPKELATLADSAAGIEQQLLAVEPKPRPPTRAALAEMWERLKFELYPECPDRSAAAGRRARAWGQPVCPPPFGPRLRWLALLGGWKLARRLQTRFR